MTSRFASRFAGRSTGRSYDKFAGRFVSSARIFSTLTNKSITLR